MSRCCQLLQIAFRIVASGVPTSVSESGPPQALPPAGLSDALKLRHR